MGMSKFRGRLSLKMLVGQLIPSRRKCMSDTEVLQSIDHRLTKRFLVLGAKLCYIDLLQDNRFYVEKGRSVFLKDSIKSTHKRQTLIKRTLVGIINLLSVVLFLRSTVHAILLCTYDYHLYRLKRIGSHPDRYQTLPEWMSASHSLKRQIETDRARLKFIGSPLMNMSGTAGLAYHNMLWLALITYFWPLIYFRYANPFNFSIIRMIIDLKMETKNYRYMISRELDKLIVSSREFFRCILQEKPPGPFGLMNFSNICSANERVKRWAQVGDLSLFNRDPSAVHHICQWYSRMCLFYIQSLAAMMLFTLFIAPMVGFAGQQFTYELDPADIEYFVETIIIYAVLGLSCGFYLLLSFIESLDQFTQIRLVRNQIKKCMKINNFCIQTISGQRVKDEEVNHSLSSRPPEALFSQVNGSANIDELFMNINSNLMLILLLYKVLVRQYKPLKTLSGHLCSTVIVVVMVVVLITNFHAKLMDSRGSLMLVLLITLGGFLCGDICLLPQASKQTQVELLYRALFSLVAQLEDMNRVIADCQATGDEQKSTSCALDQHSLVILRKELSHPNKIIEQFTVVTFGLKLNYGTMIRAHFWLGLVTVSILYSSGDYGDDSVINLNDVLGNSLG